MKDIADLIARFLISSLFLIEAIDSIFFFEKNLDTMKEYGLTWYPNILLMGAITLLVLGGIMVLIGYYANIGAFLLLLYWVPFTFIVYSFWNDPEDLMRLSQLYFMRNLAICAALLLLIANGSGKYSVKRLIHVMRLPK